MNNQEESFEATEPFTLEADEKYKQLEKAYVQQGLDFMAALGQADELTDELVRVSDQLKELQDAVMALEPFDDRTFIQRLCGEHECNICGSVDYGVHKGINHTPNCPVTKLREVLKDQNLVHKN